MIPLFTTLVVIIGVTLFFVQTYLKNIIEDYVINSQIHHVEQTYHLKMENLFSKIENNGLTVVSSPEVKNFLLSSDAKNGKMSQEMKDKLSEMKELYHLATIYVSEPSTQNYYNEKGFVKKVDFANKESQWYLNTLQSNKSFLINADSDITGSLHIWFDGHVSDKKQIIGLAGCGLDINDIYNMAIEDFSNDNPKIMILNASNKILGTSDNKKIYNIALSDANITKDKILAIKFAQANNQKLEKYLIGDDERYLLLMPLEKLNCTIVIDFSKEKFISSLHAIYNKIVIGGIILIFIMLSAGSWILTYFLSKPLKRISRAVGEHNYMSEFDVTPFQNMGYEVDMICNSFKLSSNILQGLANKYKEKQELLSNIVNAAEDLIFYKDINLRYIGCNKAYAQWTSKSIEQIIGKTDKDLYPIDIANSHIEVDKLVISQGRTIIIEEKFEKEDGSFVILQVKKSPFYDNEGDVSGLVVVARDMTAVKEMKHNLKTLNETLEKRVEEKTHEIQTSHEILERHVTSLSILNAHLTKAKEEALQAAQARSNFISSISHELRTPLNAIINFTDQTIEDFDEMLEDKELQKDTKGFLQRVIVNSKHLLGLINDLLEFTKAEAGKIDYKMEESDINKTLEMAYNNTFSLLNGIDVQYNLELYEKPLVTIVDSRRLLQVVLNLVSNAIKFTKKGKIELRSYTKDGSVIIEIEDTGKGIPADKQKTIFDPFIQADSSDNGTGLGLGLAKRMCDDMGIKILLTSIEKKGTIFQLVIEQNLKESL